MMVPGEVTRVHVHRATQNVGLLVEEGTYAMFLAGKVSEMDLWVSGWSRA